MALKKSIKALDVITNYHMFKANSMKTKSKSMKKVIKWSFYHSIIYYI